MSRRKGLVIAMDGPAGVGKSTVGGLVARSLGYKFINTGEMYRALTWKALESGRDLNDNDAVLDLAKSLKWEFRPAEAGGTTLKTFIDGSGVTAQIREERVSMNSSLVAANPGVRKFLSKLQRELGEGGGIVMEGRDITTNVFPDADVKIYLDASPEPTAAIASSRPLARTRTGTRYSPRSSSATSTTSSARSTRSSRRPTRSSSIRRG
jgi:cytidylate kinase